MLLDRIQYVYTSKYALPIHLNHPHSHAQQGTGRTSRILFVWAVRDVSHINWIAPALQQALSAKINPQRHLELDIRIFVTRSPRERLSKINFSEVDEKFQAPNDTMAKVECDQTFQDDSPPSQADSTETLVKVVEGQGGNFRFESGRPDVRKIIDEELAASDGLHVAVDGKPQSFSSVKLFL